MPRTPRLTVDKYGKIDLHVRLPEELCRKVAKRAVKGKRSLSAEVEVLVESALDAERAA
jgi:hypothetical protein